NLIGFLPFQSKSCSECARPGSVEILFAASARNHRNSRDRGDIRVWVIVIRRVEEVGCGDLRAEPGSLAETEHLCKPDIHYLGSWSLDNALCRRTEPPWLRCIKCGDIEPLACGTL